MNSVSGHRLIPFCPVNILKGLRFLIILLVILCTGKVNAQEQAPHTKDTVRTGVKYGLLPVLSFNSDAGLIAGGNLDRYNYGEGGRQPFVNYLQAGVYISTSGAFTLIAEKDQVETLGTDIRTKVSSIISQNFGSYYPGITDEQNFSKTRFDCSSYYHFKSFSANLGAHLRFPLGEVKGIERRDIKAGIRVAYESPWGVPENRFINSESVTGSEGAFLTMLDLAFVAESRDSEFRPMRGYAFETGVRYAPPVLSTHHTAQAYTELLGFVPIIDNGIKMSVAARLNLVNTLGTSPYWFKPFLGGSYQLRGYMYHRFSSDNIMAYNLELRTWLISVPFKNIELGLNFFTDGGREFSNNHWDRLFKDHKHTLGFGGVMSIFTPDYILKYDIGFSDEGIGIYMGTGYSF